MKFDREEHNVATVLVVCTGRAATADILSAPPPPIFFVSPRAAADNLPLIVVRQSLAVISCDLLADL